MPKSVFQSEGGVPIRAGGFVLLTLLLGLPAWAQQAVPQQDEIDLQARSNVVQGSGARAFGMGGAFLARADDATAASWNPAGLSYLRLPEVSAVFSDNWLNAAQTFPGGSLHDDHRSGKSPDFFAFAYPFKVGSTAGAVQISFQRVVSFDENRTFSNTSGATFAVHSTGGFDVLAFGSGLQVFRRLRVGATLNRWVNGYHQDVDKNNPRSESQQSTDFDLSAWNVNVGAIWTPSENLNLGAVVKTAFTGDVSLRRSRTDLFSSASPSGVPTVLTITNSAASGGSRPPALLVFPGAVGIGTSWRPLSPLTLSADYTQTFWSHGRIHNFFILPPPPSPVGQAPAPATPMLPPVVFGTLPYPTLNDTAQQDTKQFRLGVEYVVIGTHVKWPLRAGFFTDSQVFRGADGKAPQFVGWTLGTGLIFGPVLFDVAYIYESGDYTDLRTLGTSVASHRLFASLIYRRPAGR
jgi:long-chain fatty acid transport protein